MQNLGYVIIEFHFSFLFGLYLGNRDVYRLFYVVCISHNSSESSSFELRFVLRQIEANFTNDFAYFSTSYEIFTNLVSLTTPEYFRPTLSTNSISYHDNNYLLLKELTMYWPWRKMLGKESLININFRS